MVAKSAAPRGANARDTSLAHSAAPGDHDGTRRLEELLARTNRAGQLSFDQARELARLYRLSAARLSNIRQRGRDPEAVRYLNALCVRAYSLVHAEPPRPRRAAWFWGTELPRALGRTFRLQLLAWALLLCGGLVGARVASMDPETLPTLVPMSMYSADALMRLASSAEERELFLTRSEVGLSEKSMFSASLFTNNTRVGVLAFATGPLLGLPTLLLVLYNGLTLGAFCSMFLGTAQSFAFLAWIVPHGIPELLAIVLCASGGLAMGLSAVAPSRAGRTASLRAAASDAIALVLAAVPLFVLAALIESFVRQSQWSTNARFMVAGGVLLVLVGYLWLVSRLARRQRAVDTRFLEVTVRACRSAPSGPRAESRSAPSGPRAENRSAPSGPRAENRSAPPGPRAEN